MSCCTPDGSCHSAPATVPAPAGAWTVSYAVSGMTCEHCRAAVTREVSAVPGVRDVAVDLVAGTVTVTAADGPDDARVRAAVEEAGYELTGRV
ncbi:MULTISPECIES: heavy-metal-associated domain-containing protein [Streptomycetaceae]|uniref:Metal associated protein n=1 Tax=Streptantibioticus cattleyicolor (strain ATCC 35852 / DSM 46488 / JCM 4925 / NBRC 14057 / NRRL 8057) TaxID=1003195 RepID=F8K446_STREN|nr:MULTISPECIES: heavy-metal-associated domain-containing protein [Streptomycetaceae]AEW92585.1 metal associated protein [Streptantibioticus cattleyicolor NRRL 8057 = DSM 46488]MYS57368.1 copper-binding protein [Streptomyces sp. SID5468]CCB72941.1 Regulator [Streptantibioticus cattleyicolor NRRL 8057 = DSM 46488]